MKKITLQPTPNSKATILSNKVVEVTAPDGEVFQVLCQAGQYISEATRDHELFLIESIFDNCFSDDKEQMLNNIWKNAMSNELSFIGISPGDRQCERSRIGARIKQIRTERGIEARDLATLVGIDPANLSRIENGKYSVGIDILSKIAASLGKKIDLIDI
ncbi:MAG: helix-turn-helix transcriptional regulator [Muribaculaceae bacterium]|nr:helix-turn-helix transcriptional regulator [Muribaculaceae bacterium]